jgi:hypothetical protein
MSNINAVTKHVNGLVDNAIKSSKDHFKILQAATVASVLFAAEHGQCGPLTRLHKDVSSSDAEGIRIFIVNMTEKFGFVITGQDGKERKSSFLKFSRTEGFSLLTSENETIVKDLKAHKAGLIKAGEDELSKLPFGKMDRDAAMAEAFDSVATVKRAVMTLARHGDAAMARAINRVLGVNGLKDGVIDETAKANDPKTKLDVIEKRAEALRAQIANANTIAPATSAAVN